MLDMWEDALIFVFHFFTSLVNLFYFCRKMFKVLFSDDDVTFYVFCSFIEEVQFDVKYPTD